MPLQPNTLKTVLQNLHPDCSTADLPRLSARFTLRVFKRGSTVLAQGDVWRDIYLIQSGLIRLHFLRSDGKEFNKNFMAENSLLCPLTRAMRSKPSLFGISAIEDSEIWCCSDAAFRDALTADEWGLIQCELSARLIDSKLQREHDLLALSARLRYEKLCLMHPHWVERIPLFHLATYLGISDVSLSRIRGTRQG